MKGSIVRGEAGNFVHLEIRWNEIYLWEVDRKCVPATDFENELVERRVHRLRKGHGERSG